MYFCTFETSLKLRLVNSDEDGGLIKHFVESYVL